LVVPVDEREGELVFLFEHGEGPLKIQDTNNAGTEASGGIVRASSWRAHESTRRVASAREVDCT
jgi:hypothetical protein